jgi:hypothetical protein
VPEFYKLRINFYEASFGVSARAPSLGNFNIESVVNRNGGVVTQLKSTIILKAACSPKVFYGKAQMSRPDCVVHQRSL